MRVTAWVTRLGNIERIDKIYRIFVSAAVFAASGLNLGGRKKRGPPAALLL